MAKVLLVDDDVNFHEPFLDFLGRHNIKALVSSNAREAMELVKENPVKLVVTDIFMPDVDGIELMSMLKKERSDLNIIAISGGFSGMNGEAVLQMARSLGATFTFNKPLPVNEFVEAVKCLI